MTASIFAFLILSSALFISSCILLSTEFFLKKLVPTLFILCVHKSVQRLNETQLHPYPKRKTGDDENGNFLSFTLKHAS